MTNKKRNHSFLLMGSDTLFRVTFVIPMKEVVEIQLRSTVPWVSVNELVFEVKHE